MFLPSTNQPAHNQLEVLSSWWTSNARSPGKCKNIHGSNWDIDFKFQYEEVLIYEGIKVPIGSITELQKDSEMIFGLDLNFPIRLMVEQVKKRHP